MSDDIRVALIGYGLAGSVFHAPLISHVAGLDLAAIVSRRADAIRAAYPDTRVLATPDEAFADPAIDLVVVASPDNSHYDLAARALAAGKHVVVDKPLTKTAAEAHDLAARAKAAGRLLSAFQNRRWDADFLTIRRLIAEGALGEIVYYEARYDRFRPDVQQRWRERGWEGSGVWFDLGPHLADQALQLFGPPEGIYADLAKQREGTEVTDHFHVLLRYPRLRVVLNGSMLAPANDLRYVVHGTAASYIKHGLDTQEPFVKAGGRPGDPDWGLDPTDGVLVLADGTRRPVPNERGDYRRYYEGLRDAIRGKGPLPVTAGEAVQVMDLLEHAVESAGAGCEIRPPH